MDPADLKLPDFAAIEFHDAILEGLRWQHGGEVTLVFSHIAVYFPAGMERYEVWGCRASLQAVGVTRLEIRGAITDNDWVSDGDVWDQHGERMDLEHLRGEQAISRLELVFTNSSTVIVHASRARLFEISRTQQLEEWIGPLQAK